ncbi:hypothetical protein C7460_11953 [Marinoscillum furvescens DSM 4134]|uniref:Uncharacterized protein n=1 Tax=Marinoscillum furvescens DSM 4134 TaxID=1122208 RepID=A0A3D9KYS3_MARFU|nr:hypothetical protein C7460_11953 [Marinoscillum furvescens DSM 4134]
MRYLWNLSGYYHHAKRRLQYTHGCQGQSWAFSVVGNKMILFLRVSLNDQFSTVFLIALLQCQ